MQAVIPKKVLIVDDYEGIREVCVDILASAGYEVVTAANGAEALKILKRGISFDLIITDIHMPELDGLGLYSFAAREYPHLKERFLFMTGDLSRGLQSTLRKANLTCLTKPFGIAELIGQINRVITRAPKAAHGWNRVREKY